MTVDAKRARSNPERGKVALVLGGGGFPGWMYEIGSMTALDEFFEDGFSVNDFDIFVGTSAGACVAALLANQVRPREMFDAIREDRPSPFNFRSTDIYSFGYQETFRLLKRLGRSFFPLLKYAWQNWKWLTWIDLFHIWEEFLPSGVLTLRNFENHLGRFLAQPGKSDDFRRLRRELYIPAIDLDSGRYDVFGEDALADVPISTAVTASSAIPIIFQPVEIKGRDYIDGGVGRVTYMNIAIDHGATLMLVVNPIVPIQNDRSKVCLPTHYGSCSSLKEKGFSYIYDQGTRVSTATRTYLAFRRYQIEHPSKDFMLIQPDPSDSIMFLYNVINLAARLEILNYGYESTVAALKAGFELYERAFSKHGVKVSLKRFK